MGSEVNGRQLKEKTINRLLDISGILYKMSPRKNNESLSQIFKDVIKCHRLGYLWLGYKKGKAHSVVIAYRIPEATDKWFDGIPDKQEGNSLYVAECVSSSEDKMMLRRLWSHYKSQNSDVKEIIFHDKDDKLHTIKVKRGDKNVTQKV